MQFQVCESDDSCQPGAQYTNPRVVVEEHHGAPLLNCSGLVLVRQLIERLGVARAIDAGVRVLQRCKWYRESDHILTLIYSMISGGSRLQDVNRLGQDDALKRVLGSDRIPHATTIGKFLWRFGDDQQDKQRQGLAELRDTTAAVQQEAFGMLPRERRKVATLDWDSSIHEVYGQKKEGADFAYDNTWSYSALYGTLAETGDVLYLGLREGYRHTSYGTKEVLPGTIERVSKHFWQVRMRADSGYYSQALVKICEQRGVEFFIVAKQHRNLMNAVREIPESHWKSFADRDLQADDRRRRRRRRANLKRKIAIRRKPNSRFKGAPEIAGMMFKPKSWNKARRYVIKRTPIVDKDDQQLYLDDGLRRYVYWIVVNNSKRSNEQVLRIAQGRGNQENLIKDFKYGLGLAHIPTGSLAANQAYFMIAALAWNLKTWMLNLLHLGDGAVMRFQRFRYQWIWQAGTVAKSGRNTVVLKLPAGEYFRPPLAAVRKELRVEWYRCPIAPAKLRELMRRSDRKGWFQAGGHLGLFACTAALVILCWSQQLWFWFALALFAHGTIGTFFRGLATHELSHKTVFRTKWLNKLFLYVYALPSWDNPFHYAVSHTYHHRYTLHPEGDREAVLPANVSLRFLLMLQLFTFNVWRSRRNLGPGGLLPILLDTVQAAFGVVGGEWWTAMYADQPQEKRKAIWWARAILAFHGAILVVAIVTGLWVLPVVLSLFPFIGNWWAHFVGLPMHAGLRDNVTDFRKCVRSITLDPFSEFIYWHMNWHTEHHMYAGVPCYNLSKLYREIADDMPKPRTLIEAWSEMRAAWKRQKTDPSYQFDTPLPPNANPGTTRTADSLAKSIGDLAPAGL